MPKNRCRKKAPPITQTTPYDHGPGLPDSLPRVRGFLNKKQLSEQETRKGAHFWVHFWTLFLDLVISESMYEKMFVFLMKSETKKD